MKKEIEQKIREIAKAYGVNPDLAVKVAECESGLNLAAINFNRDGTVDRGLYQWNNYWHPEISDECAFSLECSTMAFCRAVKSENLNWWAASKPCWKVVYKMSLLTRILFLLHRVVALYRKLLKKY